jgi:hypothetical protein
MSNTIDGRNAADFRSRAIFWRWCGAFVMAVISLAIWRAFA